MADRGTFSLGTAIDPATGKPGADPVTIGSSDLTTHGVVVGMTGSEVRVVETRLLWVPSAS